MMALVSAHRCGAGSNKGLENTREALIAAIEAPVDFIEFDVQRLGDGTLIAYHNDVLEVNGESVRLSSLNFDTFCAHAGSFLLYSDVLAALKDKRRAHIDLKFVSPVAAYDDPASTYEVQAVAEAIEVMGATNIIVTTLEDVTVRAVRQWAAGVYDELLVGLSLGRNVDDESRWNRVRVRASELFPHRRYQACDANLVVVNYRLARISVQSYARRRRLPMLVWTVDDVDELAYWLHPGRAWLVMTNYPLQAIAMRKTA